MLSDNRKERILDILHQKSFVTVSELAKEFGISEVSVRKLLAALERDGVLKRNWGGAVAVGNALTEYSHREKATLNLEEKKAIAREAYREIRDGEAIFLDSGTTTMELAKLLAAGNKHNLFVATNAVNIAGALARGPIKVFMAGGDLRNEILCCVSTATIDTVKRFNFDRVFITGNHFSIERGFTTPVTQEAAFKSSLFRCGAIRYVLMDYSKYGSDSLCLIEPISQADVVITDDRAPEDLARRFEDINVRLIRAEK